MAELIWGDVAVADLESIFDYIARDSTQYARHQIERIHNAAERLRLFPESGRHIPEFPDFPHREILIDNYRLIYRHAANIEKVFIITVMHGRRLLDQTAFL